MVIGRSAESVTSTGQADDDTANGPLQSVLGGFDLTDLDRYGVGFPHDVFTRLRRDAPVLYHPPGHTADGEGFWVLSRYAEIAQAGSDIALFSSQGGGGRADGGTHIDDLPTGIYGGVMLNMMDDPRHDLFKRLLSPPVSEPALGGLEPRLRQLAGEIVTKAVRRGACDFQIDVTAGMALQSIALVLGVPEQDWPRFFGWTDVAMGYEDRDTGVVTDRSQSSLADMFNYGAGLITAKRAAPGNDLLSALACGGFPEDAGEQPLTEFERQVFFNLVSLAGTEPTRGAIAIGMLALSEHPEQWQALRADRSLLPGAIEEMLRWASPTPYNRRTATRDSEIGGTRIRAGEKVTLWWASANRDETVFPDPFRFDILRDPNPQLAFGIGGHTCLGERLGRLEMRVLFDVLLDQVAEVHVTGPVKWARNNKHIVVLRMPVELVRS